MKLASRIVEFFSEKNLLDIVVFIGVVVILSFSGFMIVSIFFHGGQLNSAQSSLSDISEIASALNQCKQVGGLCLSR